MCFRILTLLSTSAALIFAQSPGVVSVQNAASTKNGNAGEQLSPGAIATLYGSGFTTAPAQASSTTLPLSLGGLTMTIDGLPCPLYYVSPSQVNFQVPYELKAPAASGAAVDVGRSVDLRITAFGYTAPANIRVVASAPEAFSANNAAIAQNQDYSLNSAANPATAGSVVTLYFSGFGNVDNPVLTGSAAPNAPLSRVQAPFTVTFTNGTNLPILFAGLTPGSIGLAQVNIQIPNPSPCTGTCTLNFATPGHQTDPRTIFIR